MAALPRRVLEISDDEAAAAWCGQLFVQAGFDVVKGESSRRPAADRASDLFLNAGKDRVAVELGSAELASLAGQFDVVVTDTPAAEFLRYRLGDLPAPVVVSVTPFGLSGPYAQWNANAATLLALGGHTFLMGDPGRAPLSLPGHYPYYQAGNFAFVAAAATLLRAGAPGGPQWGSGSGRVMIEVSVLEVLATLHQFTDTMWTDEARIRSRHGNRWENLHPLTLLPGVDGWFQVNILGNFWTPFTKMIGREDLAGEHPWAVPDNRLRDADEVDRVILDALGSWPKERIFHEGQGTFRVPVGHLQTMQDVLDDPHLAARNFWHPIDEHLVGPRPAYRVHADESPGAGAAGAGPGSAAAGGAAGVGGAAGSGGGPLEGLRVLDLTHVWAGPLGARVLADLGADVIKVEAPDRRGGVPAPGVDPDAPSTPPGDLPWNRQPLNNKLNRNRRSLALDLKAPAGRDIFLRLVATADVLLENFSARALPSLGLGHDVLIERNPRLVHVAMPGFGLSGPYSSYVAFGPSTEPMTGLGALMGYSPDEPRGTGTAILDAMGGTLGAVSVMHGLLRRQRTGTGALIELSQHESGIVYIGEYLIRRQLEGREPVRAGNVDPTVVPQGVYRCAGDDQWIAVAARDEAEWLALASSAGQGWERDPRFVDPAARRAHRAALDEVLEAFTRTWDKLELMAALQAVGVPAGAVLSTPEWLDEPHLRARGYFTDLADADRPARRSDGLPVIIDGGRDYAGWRRAPMLGEHNGEVLREIGFDDDEIAGFETSGVIATRPRTPAPAPAK